MGFFVYQLVKNMTEKELRKKFARSGGQATLKKHGIEFYKNLSAKGVVVRKLKALDILQVNSDKK